MEFDLSGGHGYDAGVATGVFRKVTGNQVAGNPAGESQRGAGGLLRHARLTVLRQDHGHRAWPRKRILGQTHQRNFGRDDSGKQSQNPILWVRHPRHGNFRRSGRRTKEIRRPPDAGADHSPGVERSNGRTMTGYTECEMIVTP